MVCQGTRVERVVPSRHVVSTETLETLDLRGPPLLARVDGSQEPHYLCGSPQQPFPSSSVGSCYYLSLIGAGLSLKLSKLRNN